MNLPKLSVETRRMIVAGIFALNVIFAFTDPETAKSLAVATTTGFFALLKGEEG